MTVHRKRTAPPLAAARGPRRPVVRITTTSVAGAGGDLGRAAEVIAQGARQLAAPWSRQIPTSIGVKVSGNVAEISTSAPPAYPNEIARVRHPVFGHDRWVTNEHRPFMAPAADEKADPAMARYAEQITRAARRAGFG